MHGIREILGDGPRRISQAGCLLTLLATAANYYGRDHGANWSVSALNKHFQKKQLFTGSGLRFAAVLRELGFAPADRDRVDQIAIQKHLATDLVIIGIDYKPGHSSGYSDADHFAMLTDYEENTGVFIGVDPIFGHHVTYLGNPLSLYPPVDVPWIACEAIHLSAKDPEKMRTP